MIRNISQNTNKKQVQKNTKQEIQQIYKLVLLLQHLDNDLSYLQDEYLQPTKDDVKENCKNKSTDKLNGKGIREKKTCKSQKPPIFKKDIQTLDEETQSFYKDFLDVQRNKKKPRV